MGDSTGMCASMQPLRSACRRAVERAKVASSSQTGPKSFLPAGREMEPDTARCSVWHEHRKLRMSTTLAALSMFEPLSVVKPIMCFVCTPSCASAQSTASIMRSPECGCAKASMAIVNFFILKSLLMKCSVMPRKGFCATLLQPSSAIEKSTRAARSRTPTEGVPTRSANSRFTSRTNSLSPMASTSAVSMALSTSTFSGIISRATVCRLGSFRSGRSAFEYATKAGFCTMLNSLPDHATKTTASPLMSTGARGPF